MQHTTRGGVRLDIGRVPRALIDRFLHAEAPPEPPMRRVPIWGGGTEPVPDYTDRAYLTALTDYRLRLCQAESQTIAQAITILDDPQTGELAELATLGLGAGSPVDYLLYTVLSDPADLAAVTDAVLYQSTVTARGVQEALAAYDVTWQGRAVLLWDVPGTPGRRGELFLHREAAQYSHYRWLDFCELPGPEQSAIVAFYLAKTHLEALTHV